MSMNCKKAPYRGRLFLFDIKSLILSCMRVRNQPIKRRRPMLENPISFWMNQKLDPVLISYSFPRCSGTDESREESLHVYIPMEDEENEPPKTVSYEGVSIDRRYLNNVEKDMCSHIEIPILVSEFDRLVRPECSPYSVHRSCETFKTTSTHLAFFGEPPCSLKEYNLIRNFRSDPLLGKCLHKMVFKWNVNDYLSEIIEGQNTVQIVEFVDRAAAAAAVFYADALEKAIADKNIQVTEIEENGTEIYVSFSEGKNKVSSIKITDRDGDGKTDTVECIAQNDIGRLDIPHPKKSARKHLAHFDRFFPTSGICRPVSP